MNIAAFILIVLAIVAFVADYSRRPHPTYLPAGLALLAAAVMVQFVWQTPHMVVIH